MSGKQMLRAADDGILPDEGLQNDEWCTMSEQQMLRAAEEGIIPDEGLP